MQPSELYIRLVSLVRPKLTPSPLYNEPTPTPKVVSAIAVPKKDTEKMSVDNNVFFIFFYRSETLVILPLSAILTINVVCGICMLLNSTFRNNSYNSNCIAFYI